MLRGPGIFTNQSIGGTDTSVDSSSLSSGSSNNEPVPGPSGLGLDAASSSGASTNCGVAFSGEARVFSLAAHIFNFRHGTYIPSSVGKSRKPPHPLRLHLQGWSPDERHLRKWFTGRSCPFVVPFIYLKRPFNDHSRRVLLVSVGSLAGTSVPGSLISSGTFFFAVALSLSVDSFVLAAAPAAPSFLSLISMESAACCLPSVLAKSPPLHDGCLRVSLVHEMLFHSFSSSGACCVTAHALGLVVAEAMAEPATWYSALAPYVSGAAAPEAEWWSAWNVHEYMVFSNAKLMR
ncbi:hypothetical protein HPB51_024770 [Rhipicephalus microplus]|uniref:Uncharacterized protein n=1 Tax=Rhipicephalus microplus TaxID=6941 RepID=A0A9J6D8H7_RHIMP|nr:hypothetical protein HPB51_024770 [Rhipicephalus microplus]